jgi:acetoin utilization deacetylase AcuC-like enzyme
VAIVDWDVHHGNGTQDIFYDDPRVLYVSLHESPFYPGTGAAHERGVGDAGGTTVNFPLPAGTAGDVYRWLVAHGVTPQVEAFQPDWLLISAGYDAHRLDPLAQIELEAADYGAMAGALRSVVPSGRTILFLEGGYDLGAITASVAATARGLGGDHEALPQVDAIGTTPHWRAALEAVAMGGHQPG